jgi:hypothetical protein
MRAEEIRELIFVAGRPRSSPEPASLKRDPETSPGAPDNPATLLGPAEHQFKPTWQLGLARNLKACPTRGIIDDSAINRGVFGTNDHFASIGNSACRPHT